MGPTLNSVRVDYFRGQGKEDPLPWGTHIIKTTLRNFIAIQVTAFWCCASIKVKRSKLSTGRGAHQGRELWLTGRPRLICLAPSQDKLDQRFIPQRINLRQGVGFSFPTISMKSLSDFLWCWHPGVRLSLHRVARLNTGSPPKLKFQMRTK